MQVFWSDDQLKHDGGPFLKAGRLVPSPETPTRAQLVLAALSNPNFNISAPEDFGLDPLLRTHSVEYLDFLRNIHGRWSAQFGAESAVLPNDAAIAAEELRQDHARVAIVDIDVHHGNGTQAIFHDRSDVLTASMHSDPSNYYPFHTGYVDACGQGEGKRYNINVCFPADTDDGRFLTAFDRLAGAFERFQPDAIVLALGLDALRPDPHGGHRITPDAYLDLARRIRDWAVPTAIVQEGGYVSEELGPTVAWFLMEYAGG